MFRRLLLTVAAALALSACTPRDLQKELELTDVQTGWYDVGITDTGENKLVPSISLRLKNVSQEEIGGVQLNAVFRNVGEEENRGEHFVAAISSSAPLPAGEQTPPIVLRPNVGYTGTESRAQMLQNSQFVDRRVVVLLRHGRTGWVRVGEIPIERRLLTE
jgi:hypothetical protein